MTNKQQDLTILEWELFQLEQRKNPPQGSIQRLKELIRELGGEI